MAAGAVSFRYRDGSQKNGVPVADAIAEITAAVRDRVQVYRCQRPWPGPRPRPGHPARGPTSRPGVSRTTFGRLWTPHRMAYIRGAGKPSGPGEDDCPFDRAPTLSDEDGLIVARGELVYAVLNLYPYNAGHLLIVPYRHVADYTDLTAAETAEFAAYTQRAIRALRQASGAARLQHRHEPRLGGRRRHRRPPAPARGAPVGRRHQLHAGDRRAPGSCPSSSPTPASSSPTDWPRLPRLTGPASTLAGPRLARAADARASAAEPRWWWCLPGGMPVPGAVAATVGVGVAVVVAAMPLLSQVTLKALPPVSAEGVASVTVIG